MTLLVLISFDDFLRLDFFLISFRDFFVANRAQIAGPQLPEADFLLARSRIDSHRYIHEPKGDAPFPDRTHIERKAPEAFTFNTYLWGQDGVFVLGAQARARESDYQFARRLRHCHISAVARSFPESGMEPELEA